MSTATPTPTPTPSRVEARARRLLVAYPWRMRAEQGDEIVATVLDTLPEGTTRLPWGTAVDLVRGGLRTRRQRRPPFLTRLAFDFRMTIHPRWIGWVFDRLEDPHYRRNDILRRMGPILVVLGASAALQRNWALFLQACAIGAVAGVLGCWFVGERQRDATRARHGLVPGGSDPRMVWITTPRRSLLPGGAPRTWVRPVDRSHLAHLPDAELWTPEGEEARARAQQQGEERAEPPMADGDAHPGP